MRYLGSLKFEFLVLYISVTQNNYWIASLNYNPQAHFLSIFCILLIPNLDGANLKLQYVQVYVQESVNTLI